MIDISNEIVFVCDNSSNYIQQNIKDNSVQMIYFDPPFFKQEDIKLYNSQDDVIHSFSDKWESIEAYLDFLKDIVIKCYSKLSLSGLLFFHCDTSASHYIKVLLDSVFKKSNFLNEIIWTYKRWSNSASQLLESHQTIFMYSKTKRYKFNRIMTEYSPTTNVDQILQMRERNENGVVVYKRDKNNKIINSGEKTGVPLRDIWEIPFLNPKAKERVGYPTQKPIELMDRIIKISCDEGDIILDPFCGSGSMGIAAYTNRCRYIGIDINKDAIKLCKKRKKDFFISESAVKDGDYTNFNNLDCEIKTFINKIGGIPIERNKGLDGILSSRDGIIGIRFQRHNESLFDVISLLNKASKEKPLIKKIIVRTSETDLIEVIPKDVIIIDSVMYRINKIANIELSNKNIMAII
jgi:site-specific DNA-methyltransferase (adenine-specific)